jgi:hypothetical protein
MCYRDNIVEKRHCPFCHKSYYGDLGHRDCPALAKSPAPATETAVKPAELESEKKKDAGPPKA